MYRMASLTKFAGTISQTAGGSYRTFSNLNNLKNATSGSYATSSANIKGKSSSPNRPSTITLTNFGFNLPTGAEVSKVTVTYAHRKSGSLNIPAPTISLVGVNGFSSKGVAPSKTSFITSTKSFTGSALTRNVINSSSFGVKVNYPSNTNKYEGKITISYIKLTVEYKVPGYTLGIKKVSGGYNEEGYTIECSISNKNLTSYNPSLTLSAPVGFNFLKSQGTGEITVVNARTLVWNPKLTNKVGTASIQLQFNANVTFPVGVETYTGTFTLVESLYSTTRNFTATITPRPEIHEETEEDSPAVIDSGDSFTFLKVVIDEEVPVDLPTINMNLAFGFPINGNNEPLYLEADSPIQYNDGESYEEELVWTDVTTYSNNGYHTTPVTPPSTYEKFRFTEPGRYVLLIFTPRYTSELLGAPIDGDYSSYTDDTPIGKVYFDVKPEEASLGAINFSLLKLEDEELNRLGTGYSYIAESYIQHTSTDPYSRDWYRNNRIGVFNNKIEGVTDYDDLTNQQIYNNATYWSPALTNVNDYESLECEFVYDEDYPVYIIITGDYPQVEAYGFDMGTVQFTEPCIVEKAVYTSREPNGIYPEPINNIIDLEIEDSSTLTLDVDENSTAVVVYDLPLEETDDNIAIRGLQVRANIESTDNLVVYAKLHNPNGSVGQRSIVLKSEDTEMVIGELGDLWGFTTLDMKNLPEWELELSASNLLNNSEATILFNDVEIIFYLETVEKQDITIKIEGEDIAYYGAYIESIEIPEGLETDTSFLNIDGTDTNDAYRQNIREKQITVEFNLSNCDIQTSTDMLRQLTKLFVNEKDKYNRPIPKRIQFSHYPEDYFEYIMEEPFDVDNDITDYNIKAKLTIPAGTSYSLEDTVTNTVGNVTGLAAINPIITFRPSDENIQINETISGQSFNMGYAGDWQSKIVEIDCEDRRVYLKSSDDDTTPTDISKYVDHNADWFRLYGEFQFEGINCTILTVRFNERW